MAKKFLKVTSAMFLIIYILSVNMVVYAGNMINLDLFYDGKNHKYSAEEIIITIEGKKITDYDVPPIVINDRTLVPARAVFEALGAELFWNEETKEIYMTKDDDVITIGIDNKTGTKNGINFTMDVPPKIINDRTFIPVRAVTEAIGCYVGWDNKTRTVSITEKDPSTSGDNNSDSSDNTGNSNGSNSNDSGNSGSNSSDNTTSGGFVQVNSIDLPSSANDKQSFKINTSGNIEKFEKILVGNDRLAIDIYNAQMNVKNNNIVVTTSGFVSSIRTAQNQVEPVKITRIVFDLKTSSDFNVTKSSDGKSIIVSFEETIISSIDTDSSSNTDSLIIKDGAGVMYSIDYASSSRKFNILLEGCKIEDLTPPTTSKLNFIDDIEITETSAGIKITVTTNLKVEYKVTDSNKNLVIEFFEPSYKNIYFDSEHGALVIENAENIDTANFTENDNYSKLEYVINMGDDYEDIIGFGTYVIENGILDKVDISKKGGNTVLTIKESNIYCYDIYSKGDKLYIEPVNPKEKYDKIVVVDAGHGLQDPGSSGNGLVEKTVNLDLSLRLYKLLENDKNIKVYMTREDDSYMQNADRAAMANHMADLFISIHQNSSTSEKPNGTEVLYMNRSTDKPNMLTSKIAAQTILDYLVPSLGTTNRGIKERPDLIVLNQTKGAAVLIETAFLSNPDDASKLKSEEVKNKMAESVYYAIVDMFNRYPTR